MLEALQCSQWEGEEEKLDVLQEDQTPGLKQGELVEPGAETTSSGNGFWDLAWIK